MKKNLTIILTLLVILTATSFVFNFSFSNKKPIYSEKGIPVVKEDKIVDESTFETRTLKIDDPYVKFDIKYPHFLFINRDFNNGIKNFIQKEAEVHRLNSRENWLARYNSETNDEGIKEKPSTEEEKYFFFADFKIIQSNDFYISFVVDYGGYSGGAHGYQNRSSLSYDVKNKKYIELKDLFSNQEDPLRYVSNSTRNQLKGQFLAEIEENKDLNKEEKEEYIKGVVSMIEEGTEPKEDNFRTYTFTTDKVRIYFSQYQVGPYSIGMPEVEIDR